MMSVRAPLYVGFQLQLGVGRMSYAAPRLVQVTKFSAVIGQRLPVS